MPVCVNCAHPAQHLYTTYRTESNIRLGVCPRCNAFLDPLIEHPGLLILLDLILLKPRVYLHLLYNRRTKPYRAEQPAPGSRDPARSSSIQGPSREGVLRDDLVKLAGTAVLAETISRQLPRLVERSEISLRCLLCIAVLVVLELSAQHLTSLATALLLLRWKGWYPARPQKRSTSDFKRAGSHVDGRQADFLPLLIPLTLLYTSIIPLLLQLALSIWYIPPPVVPPQSIPIVSLPSDLRRYLPPELDAVVQDLAQTLLVAWTTSDRVWAGTRLLSGMSAGFGLRVVLPTRPWETTGIVLAGWGAAGLVNRAFGAGILR